jgi:Domain of unknown function (DUF4193)
VEESDESTKDTEETAEASLDELMAKKADEPAPDEEGDGEPVLESGREERVEALSVKVVPQQPTEFVCKKCFLVKHRSQLADKKRMYCVDCA